jgi:hypothetical protein
VASPDDSVRKEAIETLLRVNHAKQAEKLPLTGWTSPNGTTYFLIDKPEFRDTYGRSIGRIAHSHWWSVERVSKEFSTPLGAPGGCPNTWRVDELKLASLVRLADACHLDERRAPSFLRAIRKPQGIADDHWNFQNKLLQPSWNQAS